MPQNFTKKINYKKRKPARMGNPFTVKQKRFISSYVEKQLQEDIEKKTYDYEFDSYGINLTPYIQDILQPALGTDYNKRVGAKITLESIYFKFLIAKSDNTNYIRLVFFQWFADAGNDMPTWNQLYQYYTGTNPAGMPELLSPLRISAGAQNNFKIIMNKEFILDDDDPIQLISGYIDKGFKKSIMFSDTNTAHGQNHIYMLIVSDSGVTTHPTLSGYTRLKYTDA